MADTQLTQDDFGRWSLELSELVWLACDILDRFRADADVRGFFASAEVPAGRLKQWEDDPISPRCSLLVASVGDDPTPFEWCGQFHTSGHHAAFAFVWAVANFGCNFRKDLLEAADKDLLEAADKDLLEAADEDDSPPARLTSAIKDKLYLLQKLIAADVRKLRARVNREHACVVQRLPELPPPTQGLENRSDVDEEKESIHSTGRIGECVEANNHVQWTEPLNLQQIAKEFNAHTNTIREKLRNGEIRNKRFGRNFQIDIRDWPVSLKKLNTLRNSSPQIEK